MKEMKRKGKFLISLITIFLLIGVLSFIYYMYINRQELAVNNPMYSKEKVVQISSDYISQQKIIEMFGVNSVIYVSDKHYRLKFDETGLEKLSQSNYPYVELPFTHSLTSDGFGIWKVEIIEPIYDQKVQSLANYGTIIGSYDNSILIWASRDSIEDIINLPDISLVHPFYNYEKLSPEVVSESFEAKKINASIFLLIDNKNIELVKDRMNDLNMRIIDETESSYLSQTLESITITTEFYYSNLNRILEAFPQIVNIDSTPSDE